LCGWKNASEPHECINAVIQIWSQIEKKEMGNMTCKVSFFCILMFTWHNSINAFDILPYAAFNFCEFRILDYLKIYDLIWPCTLIVASREM
jgi:hypothetical protein